MCVVPPSCVSPRGWISPGAGIDAPGKEHTGTRSLRSALQRSSCHCHCASAAGTTVPGRIPLLPVGRCTGRLLLEHLLLLISLFFLPHKPWLCRQGITRHSEWALINADHIRQPFPAPSGPARSISLQMSQKGI